MKFSKEASRKIPAGLGLLLILELSFGGSAQKISEFLKAEKSQANYEQVEVKNGH